MGNCADRSVVPSLDVYASRSTDKGSTIARATRLTDVSSNANYEQFNGRPVPFLGDYIGVSSIVETAFAVWTDYRNTVPGTDVREAADDDADPGADVLQCHDVLPDGSIMGDKCPREGGLD